MDENEEKETVPFAVDLSDEDIFEAMKDIQGYLDITPADLKEVYKLAYRHAYDRIVRAVRAGDVMTAKVFSVKRETPLRDVAALMAGEKISGVPVVSGDGRVVGIISEKDFLTHMGSGDKKHFMAVVSECLRGGGCVAMPMRLQKAEDIMSSPAVSVEEDTPAIEIARLLTERCINRVPVTDREGRLKGIVSRSDVVRASRIQGDHCRREKGGRKR